MNQHYPSIASWALHGCQLSLGQRRNTGTYSIGSWVNQGNFHYPTWLRSQDIPGKRNSSYLRVNRVCHWIMEPDQRLVKSVHLDSLQESDRFWVVHNLAGRIFGRAWKSSSSELLEEYRNKLTRAEQLSASLTLRMFLR